MCSLKDDSHQLDVLLGLYFYLSFLFKKNNLIKLLKQNNSFRYGSEKAETQDTQDGAGRNRLA